LRRHVGTLIAARSHSAKARAGRLGVARERLAERPDGVALPDSVAGHVQHGSLKRLPASPAGHLGRLNWRAATFGNARLPWRARVSTRDAQGQWAPFSLPTGWLFRRMPLRRRLARRAKDGIVFGSVRDNGGHADAGNRRVRTRTMSFPASQSLSLPRDWWDFTIYQAWDSLRRQYARTKLGPWWVVASHFVLIGGIALVYSAVFGQSFRAYLPFISASLVTWTLIAQSLTQAPQVFIAGSGVIQAFRVPYAVFPIQLVLSNYFLFLHGIIVHVAVLIVLGNSIWLVPLALVMSILLLLVVYPIVAILGLLGARFRDLGPAVTSAVFMVFLCTPVIWERRILTDDKAWLVDLNPFAHVLEIVRSPLLGKWPPMTSVVVCLVLAVAISALGEVMFRRKARNLPFWA
jgi:lipopolysaccharide transport system permease protein